MANYHSFLQKQLAANLPFVAYKKPNSNQICLRLQSNNDIHLVNYLTESGFVFTSFDGSKQYIFPEKLAKKYVFEKIEQPITKTLFGFEDGVNLLAKKNFEDLVAKSVDEINANHFQKVVVSRKETLFVDNINVLEMFENLVNLYSNTFVYCMFHPKIGTWLGATPEQLLKASATTFETVSLAGTQKITSDAPIVWSEKEIQEQAIVTEYIVAKLQEEVSYLEVDNPVTIKAGSIGHIKTKISGRLKEALSLPKIIQLLHPTPAVCGFPKQVAFDFLQTNEGYDRKFYTGFLGEINCIEEGENTTDLYVNLRCMEVEDNKIQIYVGCGITKDSKPEKEWVESCNKASTMKSALK